MATKKQKRERAIKIQRWVSKWQDKLFLQEYRFTVAILDKFSGSGGAWAEIEVNSNYLEATISVYSSFWELDEKVQEETIVHELCHCHTDDFTTMVYGFLQGKMQTPDYIEKVRERTTQMICKIAFRDEW